MKRLFGFIDHGAKDERKVRLAAHTVPFFYFFFLYTAISRLFTFGFEPTYPLQSYLPVWGFFLGHIFDFRLAVQILVSLVLTAGFIGAIWYERKWARALVFLALLQLHAYESSFGPLEHNLIYWTLVAFLFIFLPDQWTKRVLGLWERKTFLTVFWGAQAVVLLIYSLAGLGKLWGAIVQLGIGEVSMLHPSAASLHVADWALRTGQTGTLSNFILTYPLVGWAGFLFIWYIQIFSWYAAFEPRLHRVWGILLIGSHVAIFFAMGVRVIEFIFLDAILLLNSPFYPNSGIGETARSLPVVSQVAYLWKKMLGRIHS